MPTTNTNNTTYQGEAGTILLATFNEAESIKKGLVSFAPNVRYKFNIPSLSDDGGFVNAACGWNPDGTITLDGNSITIKRVMAQREVCKETFVSAHPEFDDILEAIIEERTLVAAEKFDSDIWVGTSATAGEFGGLVALMDADANVIKPTALGAAITQDNVVAELAKVVGAAPKKVRKKADFKIVVSSDVALAYENKLIAQGVTYLADGGEKAMKYGRYMIEEVPHLDDNTIIAYQASNVWAASDVQNPENEVSAVDTDATLLDGNVRTKILFGGGTGYGHSEEIVYYVAN